MIEVKNNFRGGLNLDDDYLSLPENCYIDALNITIDAVSSNRDNAITNITGNRKVAYNLPSGDCVCIGAYPDLIRNRVIYFIWNSLGKHCILNYNNTTRTATKILENLTDTANEDILGFSRYKKIIHIEIVNRGTDEGGDLLYWTDGYTEPKGMLIDKVADGNYGTVELAFIEAAKRPPLQPPTVNYGNDINRTTNSLRRKLYQLRYRWHFDDFSKSTWSAWSETPLPANLVGTDDDLIATNNNFIATTITTGKKNVTAIEVGFREFAGNIWADAVSTVTLNKAALGLADEVQYQYNFYNDNVPIEIDQRESVLQFDYLPLLAKSMVLANGNVLVYGAITEGYDNIPQNELDVSMDVEYFTNGGADLGDPSLIYTNTAGSQSYTFTVGDNIVAGTVYRVLAFIGGTSSVITLCTYTAISTDTPSTVATQLYNSVPLAYRGSIGGPNFVVILPVGSYIVQVYVSPRQGSGDVAIGTGWPWYSRYRFGLVYFDKHGRTNGVQTYVNQPATDGDFEIETGAFQLDGSIPKTAAINAEINHLPPDWAVKYCWVKTSNLTFQRQLYYVTNDFQSDTQYYYFGLQNIQYYYDKNNKFIYSNISSIVQDGDRVRVVTAAAPSGYTGTAIWDADYEILGVVERTMTGGSDNGSFIKVKKPIASPSPAYQPNMLVIVYTPFKAVPDNENVYWEFSQFYDITGGFHMGQIQDQTISQPATFQFTKGDYYYRHRNMYTNLVTPTSNGTFLLFDANYSDFYPSQVNSDGRPEVVEVNARQTYYPATVRFGQEFQPNTSVNNLPRFYPTNFKDYNRVYGGILKMRIRDQYLKIGQELKIGVVPVNLQIIKNVSGDSQLVTSDELLNTINYYDGEFGVGDCPEAWSSFNFADYFIDNRRGAILRLSLDGITHISKLYKVNSWASDELPLRNGQTSFCYGCFDQKLNNYILSIEFSGDSESQTITFDEENNCFGSFWSASPEMMTTLGNLLIMFKNGELWTADSSIYNQFFGVNYESYITPVFFQPGFSKKTWQSVTEISTETWGAPSIYTNVNSFVGQRQESSIPESEFIVYEQNPSASIKRDIHSKGGRTNGAWMKGNWVAIKLRRQNATNLITLQMVYVRATDSSLTPS